MTSSKEQGQRMLLMGCGSVGGVIAGGLLRSGQSLTIVTANDKICRAVNAGGLHISTPEGHQAVPATACMQLGEVEGPFDVALLAMKATEANSRRRISASSSSRCA